MIYALILVLYLICLYNNSKSDFFNKKKLDLNIIWIERIEPTLIDYGFNNKDKTRIRNAYNYFIENPLSFDGATIVNDLTQIKDLDIPAMVHDYGYFSAKNIKDRLKLDWQYSQDMRKFQIGYITAYSRMIGVFIINLSGLYTITKLLKKCL